MSYAEKEQSAQDGSPVLLFEIVRGSTTYRYCTLTQSISRSGYSWLPEIVDTGKFSFSGEVSKDSLSLRFPITNSLAANFLSGSQDTITTITVYRTHYDDEEVVFYWDGSVTGSSVSGNFVTLECTSLLSRLDRQGLPQVWQKCCWRPLYGHGCYVDREDFAETGNISAVNGRVITVVEAAFTYSLIGGIFKSSGGIERMITGHSGYQITLLSPVRGLTVPGTCTLYPGCNRSATVCKEVFNNLGNFAGDPGIPGANPMGGRVAIV